MKNQNKNDLKPFPDLCMFPDCESDAKYMSGKYFMCNNHKGFKGRLSEARPDTPAQSGLGEPKKEFDDTFKLSNAVKSGIEKDKSGETPTQKTHESPVGDVEAAWQNYCEAQPPFRTIDQKTMPKKMFVAGFLARGPVNAGWVEIANIPMEWILSDGPNEGYVDIANRAGGRFPDSTWKEGEIGFAWHSSSGHEISEPTHAMLPPTPPTQAAKAP